MPWLDDAEPQGNVPVEELGVVTWMQSTSLNLIGMTTERPKVRVGPSRRQTPTDARSPSKLECTNSC
jgi:hypothetical protein